MLDAHINQKQVHRKIPSNNESQSLSRVVLVVYYKNCVFNSRYALCPDPLVSLISSYFLPRVCPYYYPIIIIIKKHEPHF